MEEMYINYFTLQPFSFFVEDFSKKTSQTVNVLTSAGGILLCITPVHGLIVDSLSYTIRLVVVVVVVALLFYVHGKHLRSCRDGQLT